MEVPYYAQWESRELVGAILRGEMRARDDPRWHLSGACSPEEYEFWSWRACGIACLKSILEHTLGYQGKLVELGKEILEAGGYRRKPGDLDGLIYAPFVSHLSKRWGIRSEVHPKLTVAQIAEVIADGALAMASVSPQIRRPESTPARCGGHLVLVIGADGGDLILHNPSGDTPQKQTGARVREDDFERFFASRGIVVSS